MTGFISRLITRHSYPQNNIVPRLPGKFESTAGATQNLFKNDFGTSDIGSTENPVDVANNGFVYHTQHNVPESIFPESGNDSEVLPDKSKLGSVKLSNANFQTAFIAKSAAEIDKHKRFAMLNGTNPVYQTIRKPSTADNEQNNDGGLNYNSYSNHNINEKNATDNKAISSGISKFFASVVSEKGEKIKESTSFQLQQPLFTTLPTLPNGVAPFTSNDANQQTVIKVHIGRIEIKAINQPPSNDAHTKKSNLNKPAMSLDDYLKKRDAR